MAPITEKSTVQIGLIVVIVLLAIRMESRFGGLENSVGNLSATVQSIKESVDKNLTVDAFDLWLDRLSERNPTLVVPQRRKP